METQREREQGAGVPFILRIRRGEGPGFGVAQQSSMVSPNRKL